ncbi:MULTISPECIES: gluconeogenesis factor YvcK family protein [Clostridium]|uniref:Putative gluconeogenesis factor n=1 Tax=Clostridium senegalense TaxID=1465809 RepID=A0A6M0H5V9_9CLOT|nr:MULTISPECIES: gluconeogenesis factor YvcK family protein [Clostridium]NEU05634.1 YvcK family protein [Clostridium senegalense]
MRLKYWLRPGLGIKRWVFYIILGSCLCAFGGLKLVDSIRDKNVDFMFLFVGLVGSAVFYYGLTRYGAKMLSLGSLDIGNDGIESKSLPEILYERKVLINGPKIVVIGGGTGLSTLLSGLKKYTSNITAIVTVADDGGGSGILRKDLGMLPPGDIRNCITALAYTQPVMEDLFRYRFKEGALENQNFGNLFLAAMHGISDNFNEAVKKTCSVLAVKGRVVPVTLDNITLCAKLKNGKIVKGESNIPKECIKDNTSINKVYIEPSKAKAIDEAIDAILEADAVVLGPGSLYTSIIPNLLVDGITEAIEKSNGLKIYISNILTQMGESDNYSVEDHIKAIYKHSSDKVIDYAIVNDAELSEKDKAKCVHDDYYLVKQDNKKNKKMKIQYIRGNFIKLNEKGHIKHNEDKLAATLVETVLRKSLFYDDKRIIEFFYLSHMLKESRKSREKK